MCVFVYIKLHITTQPGPDILIFLCHSNISSLWGSVIATVTTSSDKTRQKGTGSLYAFSYGLQTPLGFLFVSIVT